MATAAGARRAVIFGANTDVGKTVVSCGLVRAACGALTNGGVAYVKPLQTGAEHGHSDERAVRRAVAAAGLEQRLRSATLYSWGPAVSAHVAAEAGPAITAEGVEDGVPSDHDVCARISAYLDAHADAELSFVETAGGVLSPGPARTMQADMYAGLKLPVMLVGDGRLGGISSTICAVESLRQRGYEIPALAILEDPDEGYGNTEYLQYKLGDSMRIFGFGALPPEPEPLDEWHAEAQPQFEAIVEHLMKHL
ncbi:Bifunctional dethiobiotin synthetase/7,8-diamino-pelargonic acid aminotransferase, mitochondrial [Hondaea fermentalgiana]|uniref:Bifunctional dethiobiotin synthetase/7,8-diamino-pelargonic acid aminotransferase, mitochondrial n=1 Tax=Hondaea fermentalgiana TaxID=2315210 RepID=A0A2R5G8M6_9STRA|nr:Bifunctional dethiobiotin synthetase/7,8-diamino-pelargonic acid aminotransferase, mitochondrial [Hondaea fermentalgiana]|eukprot:GBG27416.1 Bifunctional dethiobiotin synthetase/7,8-diamino-pelargonic acid aminotransferase, mitochondrial [Hondaea fermentalgiana]